MNRFFGTLLVLILVGSAAYGVDQIVNQGSPGTRGPWPVTSSSSGTFPVTPQLCTTLTPKITSVGTSAASTPSSQLASRRYIVLCNSLQNSGNPLVKCRADGVAPVMAAGNAGDVLGVGDCLPYPVSASTVIQCISDASGTNVLSSECL